MLQFPIVHNKGWLYWIFLIPGILFFAAIGMMGFIKDSLFAIAVAAIMLFLYILVCNKSYWLQPLIFYKDRMLNGSTIIPASAIKELEARPAIGRGGWQIKNLHAAITITTTNNSTYNIGLGGMGISSQEKFLLDLCKSYGLKVVKNTHEYKPLLGWEKRYHIIARP